VAFNCKAQTQLVRLNDYTTEIVGAWVSDEDPSNKIEFTPNGIFKIYIDDNLEGTFTYSLNTICASNSNNGYDVYLKLNLDDLIVCHIINNIHTDSNGEVTLSITTERGQLELFTKQ